MLLGSHLAKGEWAEITALCRKSVQVMLGLKLAHVGVNAADAGAAADTAKALAAMLQLDVAKDGKSSLFVDKYIEVMKGGGLGANGHIGFSTPCLDRAVRYFEAMGIAFRPESAKRDASGKLTAIYFAQEIGGFAIHLLKA